MTVRELCDRYEYPPELAEVLSDLVGCIEQTVESPISFIVSGSLSTGDFVWRRDALGLRFLSDIDATLFVADQKGSLDRLRIRIGELERRHASPLFHIDLSVARASSIGRMESRFQHVETRMSGVVLLGADLTSSYPTQFDPAAVRQSTLGNVWKCVLNWSDANSAEDEPYRMALSRSILDLPILMCCDRGECLPGHAARARAFMAIDTQGTLSNVETREAIRLGIRMREIGDVSREELEAAAMCALRAALRSFSVSDEVAFSASSRAAQSIGELLPTRSLRRIAGESRGVIGHRGVLAGLRWWSKWKEPIGIAGLLGLFALIVEGSEERDCTNQIADRLDEYSGGQRPVGTGSSFIASARRAYWEGRCRLYSSDRAKADFYRALLGHEAESKSG